MNYKLLGRSGLRVSELCLGTMTFGEDWGFGASRAESEAQFNLFLENGGNFFDTANRYTEGTSEIWLGEMVKASGRRDELVIATKYSLYTQPNRINDGGNHRKNLVQSVEGSLRRLGLDYIDLLYLHAWDFSTPVDEVMRSLDDLVRAGKVLYLGISDTPAWIVSRANTLAELQGWSRFIAMQVEYSLITRDAERELIPMSKEMGLAITAWGPLAGGALTGKYLTDNEDPKRLVEGSKRLNEKSRVIAQTVVELAEELSCSPSHVALRWLMMFWEGIIPVVGARTVKHVADNIGVVNVDMNREQWNRLATVSSMELGFPHEFLASELVQKLLYSNIPDRVGRGKH